MEVKKIFCFTTQSKFDDVSGSVEEDAPNFEIKIRWLEVGGVIEYAYSLKPQQKSRTGEGKLFFEDFAKSRT
jgi:hypothetical protein